ncbi:MAG: MarR family transcriptional regulator [Atopobiaceae bacterium]|nr:MarR family transcriptional regulator [Atopobiaceae bacterium]
MELREYLSIRRAYNLVRQQADGLKRLTFAEFAILCRLDVAGGSLKTSEIAEYQGSLRPTMTHRTKHLAALGLIERLKGNLDKRNVVCKITQEGIDCENDLCTRTCSMIGAGQALSRVTPDRMRRYVDAMGSVACMSGELIILGLYASAEESCSVTDLVDALGLLQPTVSMSVSSLVADGLLERVPTTTTNRSTLVRLTDSGRAIAEELTDQIEVLVVRRKARSS